MIMPWDDVEFDMPAETEQPAEEGIASPREEQALEGDGRTDIYNLIVLDESGSMSCVQKQTIDGCNETINTIRAAQEKYAETQRHYVSIFAFQRNDSVPSRYLIKNVPVDKVRHITMEDYVPCGSTPLYDAVGSTLVDLKSIAKTRKDAVGSVTIITDGCENCSRRYTLEKVATMIDGLKELGWNFNFIGANIDVQQASCGLHIDNAYEFAQDDEGMQKMFKAARRGRERLFESYNLASSDCYSADERVALRKKASAQFFEEEAEEVCACGVTPNNVATLSPDEVFVFGSNLQGHHGGGAARTAHEKFGAVWGEGVGHFGQSYAIPTMQGGVETIKPYVDDFIAYAQQHSELRFLVTAIGCGIAGFLPSEIAPLFRKALPLSNVSLPESFLQVLTGK